MMFQIEYKQTTHERYDTTMNADVRDVLEAAHIEIVEEFGGTGLSDDPDDLVAEAGFVVETTLEELAKVAEPIKAIVGREVKVDAALADEGEV